MGKKYARYKENLYQGGKCKSSSHTVRLIRVGVLGRTLRVKEVQQIPPKPNAGRTKSKPDLKSVTKITQSRTQEC